MTRGSERPTPRAHRPSPLRTRVLAELRWHRRSIAAALAALALLAALGARSGPATATTPAVVAVRDIAAGEPVPLSSITLLDLPTDLLPDSALTEPREAVGRPAALPVTRGEVLTATRLLGPALLDALQEADVGGRADDELVAAPVTLADPGADGLLQVGDTVDVLAAGEVGTSGIVAANARVLRAPSRSSSVLGGEDTSALVLAVTSRTAVALARAAATARLSVVVRDSSTHAGGDAIGVR